MVRRLVTWWRWLPLPWRTWKVVLSVAEADEIPDQIAARGAVIVGSAAGPKWLAFDCPCRRHHRVILNLSPSRRPVWRVLTKSPLSLIPSVDEISDGQRCHYVLQRGEVRWVRKRTWSKR